MDNLNHTLISRKARTRILENCELFRSVDFTGWGEFGLYLQGRGGWELKVSDSDAFARKQCIAGNNMYTLVLHSVKIKGINSRNSPESELYQCPIFVTDLRQKLLSLILIIRDEIGIKVDIKSFCDMYEENRMAK